MQKGSKQCGSKMGERAVIDGAECDEVICKTKNATMLEGQNTT
jgi:hypothetical protein